MTGEELIDKHYCNSPFSVVSRCESENASWHNCLYGQNTNVAKLVFNITFCLFHCLSTVHLLNQLALCISGAAAKKTYFPWWHLDTCPLHDIHAYACADLSWFIQAAAMQQQHTSQSTYIPPMQMLQKRIAGCMQQCPDVNKAAGM